MPNAISAEKTYMHMQVSLAFAQDVMKTIIQNYLSYSTMVHCNTTVDHPMEQAVWGSIKVFLDTILVCSVSGLSIVLSGL